MEGLVFNLATLTAAEGPPLPGFDREARALYTALRESGFALIDCTRGLPGGTDARHPLVASLFGPAKRFFAKPRPQKLEAEELGYRPADSRRGYPELFQLQLGVTAGREMPDFCSKAKLALAQVLSDAREVLLALGWALAPNDPDSLASLLDKRPLPLGGTSASHLRVLKYEPAIALAEHTDRGLLTFTFASSGGTHALELLDQRSGEWVRPPASMCVLLVGHTLEAATAGAFTACRHRVSPAGVDGSDARISLAFQIRARPTAILDPSFVPVGLRRVALAPVGTTVGALMADFGHSHTSVVGLGDDSNSRTAKQEAPRHSTGHPIEPLPKRQRAAASQAPSEVLTRKFLNLIVKGQDGEAVHFKIIVTTPLKKVMDAYCARRQVHAGSVAFLLGKPHHPRSGTRLSPTETPLQLEMEDGDEIDAILHHAGD